MARVCEELKRVKLFVDDINCLFVQRCEACSGLGTVFRMYREFQPHARAQKGQFGSMRIDTFGTQGDFGGNRT